MSIRCQSFLELLEQWAPLHYAEDCDNVGLHAGDRNKEISKIMVALSPGEQAIDAAVKAGVDMLLTHHPLIFRSMKQINSDTAAGRSLLKLIRNDVNLYCAHTNLDIAKNGVNDVLASALCLEEVKPLADLKKDGFFVTLNHPVWSNMCNADIAAIQGFDAMEICNSIALMFNNFSDDSALYEYFLRSGGKAIPIAADDCHRKYADGTPFAEYGKSFVMVKAKERTYDALFRAITTGACYASTGPKIENLWLEGDTLHVQCSPVFGVYVHSMYLNKKAQLVEKADTLTEATFDISHIREASPYFWVQLRTLEGRKAWATPYWFEK